MILEERGKTQKCNTSHFQNTFKANQELRLSKFGKAAWAKKKKHYHMHASAKKHPSIKKDRCIFFHRALPHIPPALFILHLSLAHRAKTTCFSIYSVKLLTFALLKHVPSMPPHGANDISLSIARNVPEC